MEEKKIEFHYSPERTCGSCSACCEGWLTGVAHGQFFQPGRPCHFKGADGGCTIYEDRPENPCKQFKCEYLINRAIPEWMRPDKSGIILVRRKAGDVWYLAVHETFKKIDSSVLIWLINWQSRSNVPMRVLVDGGWVNIGPEEFVSMLPGLRVVRESTQKEEHGSQPIQE